jgi:2,4-dienoyl-CoA reductase-like NADH-dependent reductase (Old Yellow Enzyme family)
MTDWHVMHLGNLALSGASMLVIEATGVTPEGRITLGCTGLYSDGNERAMKRVIDFVRTISPIRIGVQLAHAGRKASAERPWEGRGPLAADQGAWQTIAPSAVPFAPGWHTPNALDRAGMDAVRDAFVASARRSERIGLDFIEVHSTHGYLLSEFLSPLINRREDEYGGSLENRMRFPLEVMRAVRAAWPDKPLGAKISGTDFAEGGWTPDDAVAYAAALKRCGLDYVTVSGGGAVQDQKVPTSPGYQVPYAERVKKEAGITTGAVGLIATAQHADEILASGKADFISLARGMLFDPRWGWHAAVALGADAHYPPQYERCGPKLWPPAREWKA